MNIAGKTILITDANRGIGPALLDEVLPRGAKGVYAGTRGALQHPDNRVIPLALDVTSASHIRQAVREVDDLNVLINNAGVAIYDDLTNVDVLSNMTQSLRAILAGRDVSVHAVFLGAVDTDMNRRFDIPKASPEAVAKGILDGLQKGDEDIFPDPASQYAAEGWRNGVAKGLEREFAAFVSGSAS